MSSLVNLPKKLKIILADRNAKQFIYSGREGVECKCKLEGKSKFALKVHN